MLKFLDRPDDITQFEGAPNGLTSYFAVVPSVAGSAAMIYEDSFICKIFYLSGKQL